MSGAHLNPAVTLPLAVTRKFPWHHVPAYLALTFILVLVILSVATDERVNSTAAAALAIGFSLAVGVQNGGPITGGAVNPARALGPMIIAGKLTGFWIYLNGPPVGGVIAALLYDRFLAKPDAPTIDENSSELTASCSFGLVSERWGFRPE